MDRVDVADRPVPDPFAERADRIRRVALVAQLGDDAMLAGGLHQCTDFKHAVRQRLFAIDVFAALDCRHCRHGVAVVGRGDDHGIDPALQGIEHLAEVAKPPGGGKSGKRLGSAVLIDVAEGDHVDLRGYRADHGGAPPAGADGGDVQSLAGRGLSAPGECAARHNRGGRQRRGSGEPSPRNQNALVHRCLPVIEGRSHGCRELD